MYMTEEIEFYNKLSYKDRTINFRLKDIFSDHWDDFIKNNSNLNIRPVVLKEVNKMISCRTSELGYSVYECPDCGEIKFSYHTCKSRFCPSCGNKYVRKRTEAILQKCYNCKHRHIVFTISDFLWDFFRKDRKLLDLLFQAVSKTILSWFKDKYKSQNYIPGIIAVLHTYGRDMKWNPHIHVLIAEKLFNKISGAFKNLTYFDYDALSKRFQKVLLDLMKDIIPCKVIKQIYNNHKNGFYVYAEPKNFSSLKDGVEYVSRYCGRPCISENRIISYDGDNVTFWYNAHEDESYHEVTVPVYVFIKLILRHIIPYQFKTIRSYGFYRKNYHFMIR